MTAAMTLLAAVREPDPTRRPLRLLASMEALIANWSFAVADP